MKKVIKKIKEAVKVIEPKKVEPKVIIPKIVDPHEESISDALLEISILARNKSSIEIVGLLNDCLRHIRNA
jgi:hypothetical protein